MPLSSVIYLHREHPPPPTHHLYMVDLRVLGLLYIKLFIYLFVYEIININKGRIGGPIL